MQMSAEGRRMTVEIISWSVSMKVWDRARIELATPGSAVRLASVARHITDCATQPCLSRHWKPLLGFALSFLTFPLMYEKPCLNPINRKYLENVPLMYEKPWLNPSNRKYLENVPLMYEKPCLNPSNRKYLKIVPLMYEKSCLNP